MKRSLFLVVTLLFSVVHVNAQSRKAIETSTDIAMFAPAAVGATVALAEGDYKGLLQLGESLAA